MARVLTVAKRIGAVVAAAAVASVPAALYLHPALDHVPAWYTVSAVISSAIGIGIFGSGVGFIALVAARGREDGGVKTAIIIACIASIFSAAVVIRSHMMFGAS